MYGAHIFLLGTGLIQGSKLDLFIAFLMNFSSFRVFTCDIYIYVYNVVYLGVLFDIYIQWNIMQLKNRENPAMPQHA